MAMDIRPASALRTEYNELATRSRMTGQPIYITRNGHADLIVMSARAYEERALLRQQVYEYEMEIKERAERAYAEIEAGAGIPLEEALKDWG